MAEIFVRVHSNSNSSRVAKDPNGSGWLALAETDTDEDVDGGLFATIEEARDASNTLAHPHCDGNGCGEWMPDRGFTVETDQG